MASASELISKQLAAQGDWRGPALSRMRALILAAVPEVVEELKWGGTPVWSKDGILCTGETYKAVVKLTFARGAALEDPARLFNASLEGNMRRAIDIREGEVVQEAAFKALVRAAASLNASRKSRPAAKPARKPAPKPARKPPGKAVASKPATRGKVARPKGTRA